MASPPRKYNDWCAELTASDVTRHSLPLPTNSIEEYIDHLQWFDREAASRLGA
jgi:hypothetical protein